MDANDLTLREPGLPHGNSFQSARKSNILWSDYWDPKDAPDRFITVPDGVGFDEVIESVTTQVRQVADAIATDGEA